MSPPPARSLEQRVWDTLHRLEHDVDAWIATADPDQGEPWMVPLSFDWDGGCLLIATPASSPTGRNMQTSGKVRIGIGSTRDVVLIEGMVERSVSPDALDAELGNSFAARTGFDPRRSDSPFRYYFIRPRRIQAWREENELDGRLLMRDGVWLAG